MLYENISTLADSLDGAADALDMVEDANPGVVMVYRVIARTLRRELAEEDSLFMDIAEFSMSLGGLAQVEPNVGARTAYALVASRLEGILQEHA